uniref:Uncharacterized protein n=1 Tax=Anguilla anguilla TaxID=7936 RepID=A0A0E9TD23_ANGAN
MKTGVSSQTCCFIHSTQTSGIMLLSRTLNSLC